MENQSMGKLTSEMPRQKVGDLRITTLEQLVLVLTVAGIFSGQRV